ncbi:Hypothetical protein A7982_01921 [Minicystis rosea]|nr:Hypothetical protein A7982_01921 [Minicystis rosea]
MPDTTKTAPTAATPIRASFRTVVDSEDDGVMIEIPFDVKALFGKARPPVRVTVNGYTYPSTVSVYSGRSYLPLRRSHREKAKIEPGATVDVIVELDTSERTVEVPDDLAAALAKNAKARTAWEKLSFTHRREHVEAILSAKKPETRARRVANALAMLIERG